MTPEELRQKADEANAKLGNGGQRRLGVVPPAGAFAKPLPESPFNKTADKGVDLVDTTGTTSGPIAPVSAPAAPEPVKIAAQVNSNRDLLVRTLLDAPARIFDAQARFDDADRAYKARVTNLSIEALSAAIFPGKKPEDGKRPAGNDTERELAVQQLLGTDTRLIELAQEREAALRTLQRDRNTFDAAKLAVQLLAVAQ